MEILMNLVGAAIALYIIIMGINYFPKTRDFFTSDALIQNPFSRKLWFNALKNKKWRNQILFTFLIIVVYRLGYFLPLPGVSPGRLQEIISFMHSGGNLPPMTMVVLPGGALDKCRLFALGLMPFLTACALLQLISFFVPPLRRKFYQGQAGFFQIRKLTVWLSYLLAGTIGFFSAQWYARFEFQGIRLIPNPTWPTLSVIIISWMAGFSLILWMANLISRHGIGNGWAVLLGTDILSRLLGNIYWSFLILYNQRDVQPLLIFVYILLLGTLIIFLSAAFRWRRYLSIALGPTETKFSLDLSFLSSYPLSLAMSIVMLPVTLAFFMPFEGFNIFIERISRGNFLYYLLIGLLTVLLSRFYVLVVVARPDELSRLFARYGVEIDGFSEGKDINELLRKSLKKVALLIGALLTVFAILPDALGNFLLLPFSMLSIFNGISVLILFGIMSDISAQLRARLEMEKTGQKTACHIAPVEIEGRIKKCFLESKGISCVIEPYGFTWGLPIRTAGSYYKLNVEAERAQDAADLLR